MLGVLVERLDFRRVKDIYLATLYLNQTIVLHLHQLLETDGLVTPRNSAKPSLVIFIGLLISLSL